MHDERVVCWALLGRVDASHCRGTQGVCCQSVHSLCRDGDCVALLQQHRCTVQSINVGGVGWRGRGGVQRQQRGVVLDVGERTHCLGVNVAGRWWRQRWQR